MANYEITFKRSVTKDLLDIPQQDVIRILRKIERLAADPRAEGCIKIAGKEKELYRIRQGSYRIVYEIFDKRLVVSIIKVGHRGRMSITPYDLVSNVFILIAPQNSALIPSPAGGCLKSNDVDWVSVA